jgi:malonate transporter and related proteins
MMHTIVGALLPIVITLLLGYAAGWHKDFDAGQASILNRMVMLYALPLNLFAGLVGTDRDQVLSQGRRIRCKGALDVSTTRFGLELAGVRETE